MTEVIDDVVLPKIEISRNDMQERIFSGLSETIPVESTVTEIKKQMKIYSLRNRKPGPEKQQMPEEDIRRLARGILFEKLSLAYLHEVGEPTDPELSEALLDIVRNPSYVVKSLSQRVEMFRIPGQYKQASEDFKVESKEGKFNSVKKHPHNNDSIAIDVKKDEETGELKATVLGTYEVKNYWIGSESSQNKIINQLEKAKENAIETIELLGKYIPLYLYLHQHENIPKTVSTVQSDEFKQVIIQPDSMFKDKADQKKYEDNYEGYRFEYIPFNKSELRDIYELFEDRVLEKLAEDN